MKKKLLSIVAATGLALSAFNVSAQAFDEGKSVVTLGYGFPNIITASIRAAYNSTSHTNYSFKAFGPMFLRYEYGLSEKIGMGVVLGYSMASISYDYQDQTTTGATVNYTAKIQWNSPTAGLRFNIHFATKEKLDPYFAVGAGWSGNTLTYTDNNPNQSKSNNTSMSFTPIYFGLGVGLKYYFTENIGMYAEFGFDKWALMQVGLAAKF